MGVRLTAFFLTVVLLTGCKSSDTSLNQAIALRNKIIESKGCSFSTTVTADYGEQVYVFSMDCKTDETGDLNFTVTEPATIAGITGKVSNGGGAITFDDKVLAFQTMADGQVTPVMAPWLFLKGLRSGYLKDCAALDSGLQISIDDTYAEDALQLQIITNDFTPISSEIFWKGRRVLTLQVENFICL